MKKRNLAVNIGELPYRTHTLNSESMGKIFGGECAPNGYYCADKGKGFCCSGSCMVGGPNDGRCDTSHM
jgi:hypothetical protein